jgi:hypothetical protein
VANQQLSTQIHIYLFVLVAFGEHFVSEFPDHFARVRLQRSELVVGGVDAALEFRFLRFTCSVEIESFFCLVKLFMSKVFEISRVI